MDTPQPGAQAVAHPLFAPENLSDQEQERLRNLQGLVAAGINPYPARVQRTLLLRRLADNARSAYGRAHGFATIGSVADFQRRVPVTRYDALAPYLARVAAGEAGVLSEEPVRLMERSGGSTASATKLKSPTRSLSTSCLLCPRRYKP